MGAQRTARTARTAVRKPGAAWHGKHPRPDGHFDPVRPSRHFDQGMRQTRAVRVHALRTLRALRVCDANGTGRGDRATGLRCMA
ncbi:hypothetical protein Veis_2586 [Verminephrobacter eiseniae EF01-2]|uniref:Uncharacterized protein n=1 Tax=Verminephrobacter eiseniae (strain EF01-2) TaxID=391735 RepID=A1WL24_VEREI|nr:hypothetical protein Veis_2586 [Verminephrobacter eiseniae EF01-2]